MAKWSQDSKVGEMLKDPAATAVLEKFIPGMSTNPQIAMVAQMTLKTLAGFPQANISSEQLAEIDAELQAIE